MPTIGVIVIVQLVTTTLATLNLLRTQRFVMLKSAQTSVTTPFLPVESLQHMGKIILYNKRHNTVIRHRSCKSNSTNGLTLSLASLVFGLITVFIKRSV